MPQLQAIVAIMSSPQGIVLAQYLLNGSWVLLPLIPTLVLYLILPPGEVAISGPFKGLTIRATGTFAAYLIIFLAAFPLVQYQNASMGSLLHPSWEISGRIDIEDDKGNSLNGDIQNPTVPIDSVLHPDPIQLMGDGRFVATVPEINGEIPEIELRYRDIGSEYIDVSHPIAPSDVKRDPIAKKIEINSRIRLTKTCSGSLCGAQSDRKPAVGPPA